jgi:LPXTG-site transpeptidase (sortase) family protein
MRKVSLIITVALVGLTFVLPATAARSSARDAITIPKIGVTAKIGAGLSRGAIYWQRVGRPGQGTTIAIAAHDITPVPGFRGHGPFHDINRLAKGDRVTVTHTGRRYTYRVTGRRILASSNMHMADLTHYERLLLTTCWPRGSSKYRLVVYARPAKL